MNWKSPGEKFNRIIAPSLTQRTLFSYAQNKIAHHIKTIWRSISSKSALLFSSDNKKYISDLFYHGTCVLCGDIPPASFGRCLLWKVRIYYARTNDVANLTWTIDFSKKLQAYYFLFRTKATLENHLA